jgi:cytidine deaminase
VTPPDQTLSTADLELIKAARQVAVNSYSRYSHFPVGAAIRLRCGTVVVGTNVETGSYGGTICAERSALTAARSSHGAKLAIESLAVVGTRRGVRSCPPCPICRNMMSELMPRDARVLFRNEGNWTVATVADLVPFPFELEPKRARRSARTPELR